MTDIAPIDWAERQRLAADEAARKKLAKVMRREERARARAYGIPLRHARKLARNRAQQKP